MIKNTTNVSNKDSIGISTKTLFNQYASKYLLDKKDSLNNESLADDAPIKTLLITGASGFLALHLIDELVKIHTVEKIICVLRNRNKFKINKEYYQLNFDESKIVFIEKDINDLIKEDVMGVDKVVHSAAQTHALKTLSQLYSNNVQASFHLYNICESIPIVFISTLSVFVSSNKEGLHEEQEVLPSDEHILYGGYAQSKWLSEYCAPPGSQSIRLGLLTAHSEKAIFPENDFFSTMVKNLYELNIMENNAYVAQVDVTPVNLATDKIVKNIVRPVTKRERNKKSIMHIANTKSVSLNEIIKIIKEIKKSPLIVKNLTDLPKIQQILMRFALNAEDMKKNYPQYFNVNLFQATNHTFLGENMLSLENEKIIRNYCKTILTMSI